MWFLVLMVLSGFFWLGFGVVISRYYGPVGYGIMNTAQSLENFAWVVLFGGLSQGLMKYGSEYAAKSAWKLEGYFSSALKYMTLLGIAAFVLITLASSAVSDPILRIITLTVAVSFLFSGTKDALAAMIGSFQKSDHLSMVNSSVALVMFAVGVVFILAGMPSYMLSVTIVCGTIWQLGLSIYFLRSKLKRMIPFSIGSLFGGGSRSGTRERHPGGRGRFGGLRQFGKVAAFGMFISLGMISFNVMKSLDIVVMKAFFDYDDVGVYSVADGVSSILFYMTSFSLPLIPAIAEARARRDRKLLEEYVRIAVKYPVLIGVPLTLVIMAMAGPIVTGIYGEVFAGAVLPLQVLIVGTFMLMFGYNLSSILIGIGKPRLSGTTMAVAAVQYIISLFILVPMLGFVGAALSLTLTGLTSMLLVPYYLKRELGFSMYGGLHKVLAAAAAMALVLFAVPKSNLLFIAAGVVAGVAAFVAVLYALGYVTRDDLQMLRIAGGSFKKAVRRKRKK
jgi:O-antigen/teichoic acid export membrane protein